MGDLCGLDVHVVGGLGVDQKCIFTRNEVITWQFDSLKEHGCRKCWAVLGVWKKWTHCWSRIEHVFILTTIHTFATFLLPLAGFVSFLLFLWSSVPVPNDFVVFFFSEDVTTNKEAARTTSLHIYRKARPITWTNNGSCSWSQWVRFVVRTRSK